MSRIQLSQGNGGGYVTTQNVVLSAPTAGNTIKVIFGCGSADFPDITDNRGNTYTLAKTSNNSGNRQINIYYAYNVSALAPTITLKTWGDAGHTTDAYADRTYIIIEESGLTTTDPLDQVAGATTNGTAQTSGNSPSTSQASEHVVGATCVDASTPANVTYTGDGAYTTIITQTGFDLYTSSAYQDAEISSVGVQSITITTSNTRQGATALATFKKTGGVVAFVPTITLPLLGVG